MQVDHHGRGADQKQFALMGHRGAGRRLEPARPKAERLQGANRIRHLVPIHEQVEITPGSQADVGPEIATEGGAFQEEDRDASRIQDTEHVGQHGAELGDSDRSHAMDVPEGPAHLFGHPRLVPERQMQQRRHAFAFSRAEQRVPIHSGQLPFEPGASGSTCRDGQTGRDLSAAHQRALSSPVDWRHRSA